MFWSKSKKATTSQVDTDATASAVSDSIETPSSSNLSEPMASPADVDSDVPPGFNAVVDITAILDVLHTQQPISFSECPNSFGTGWMQRLHFQGFTVFYHNDGYTYASSRWCGISSDSEECKSRIPLSFVSFTQQRHFKDMFHGLFTTIKVSTYQNALDEEIDALTKLSNSDNLNA